MKHAVPAASAVLAVVGTTTALADTPAAAPDWSVSFGIASFSAPAWLGDDDYRTGLAPSLDVGYKGRVFASTTEGIGANFSDMMIKFLAAAALAVSVAACSSSGHTGALLIESAQACGAVCADHPGIGSIAYEAGDGSPLLFDGKVSVDCECSDASR